MAMSGNVSQIGEESRSNIETLIDLFNKHEATKLNLDYHRTYLWCSGFRLVLSLIDSSKYCFKSQGKSKVVSKS